MTAVLNWLNSYPFDKYTVSITDGDFIVKTSSGDASQIYRISLESKVFAPPLGHFFLYLVTGVSYTIQHTGQMNLTGGLIYRDAQDVVIPSQMNYYWMHSLGTGFRYYFVKDFGVRHFTGKWYENYTTRSHLSVYLGVVYVLCALTS